MGSAHAVLRNASNMTRDNRGYTYAYDYENRITEVKNASDTTIAEYAYDALGRRIRKIDYTGTTDDVTYCYYSDRWQVLQEHPASASDQDIPSSNYDKLFIWGNYIDELVYEANHEDGFFGHFVPDHLYSNVAAVDYVTETVAERYEYDAYGKATIYNADYSQVRSETAIGNDYLFTGRRYDPETGNHYYRNRYYSPTLGRFLQNDPLGYVDGMNMYQYCGDNALYWIDPMGLNWLSGIIEEIGAYLNATPEQKDFIYEEFSKVVWDKTNGTLDGVTCGKCDLSDITGVDYTSNYNDYYNSQQTYQVPLEKLTSALTFIEPYVNEYSYGVVDGIHAWADGVIPFDDPFARYGLYEKSDPDLKISRRLGHVSRDALILANLLSKSECLAEYIKKPFVYEIGQTAVETSEYYRLGLQFMSPLEKGNALLLEYGNAFNVVMRTDMAVSASLWKTGLTPTGWISVVAGIEVLDLKYPGNKKDK